MPRIYLGFRLLNFQTKNAAHRLLSKRTKKNSMPRINLGFRLLSKQKSIECRLLSKQNIQHASH
jgi:hypothetical protein